MWFFIGRFIGFCRSVVFGVLELIRVMVVLVNGEGYDFYFDFLVVVCIFLWMCSYN